MAITKVTKRWELMCWCPHWAGVKAQLCWKVWERREDSLLHGVEWSCILAPRTAHRARSLSSARRQPAQLKQCSAGHHTCEPCLTMSYNIQRLLLVETVHFSVESIELSMVKHVAKHGLHVCRRFCLSLGCAIPSSSTSLYLDIYCIYPHSSAFLYL